MLSFTFLVTGYKGLHALQWFSANHGNHVIKGVFAEPDSSIANDYFDEIKNYCFEQNIPFARKENFLPPADGSYIFVIGWRWMLPVNDNTIVFHDSLLPGYRGFSPLVNALINGEPKIGASALMAAPEYDRGDILFQESFLVTYPIKIEPAIRKMAELYCLLLQKIIDMLATKTSLKGQAQNEKEASYSLWRDEEDYRINWHRTSAIIKREIDALGYPYAGAFTLEGNRKIIVSDAEEVLDVAIENRMPGKVIFLQDGCPVVVCGTGLLKITLAVDALTGNSFLPLKKIRTRFK